MSKGHSLQDPYLNALPARNVRVVTPEEQDA